MTRTVPAEVDSLFHALAELQGPRIDAARLKADIIEFLHGTALSLEGDAHYQEQWANLATLLESQQVEPWAGRWVLLAYSAMKGCRVMLHQREHDGTVAASEASFPDFCEDAGLQKVHVLYDCVNDHYDGLLAWNSSANWLLPMPEQISVDGLYHYHGPVKALQHSNRHVQQNRVVIQLVQKHAPCIVRLGKTCPDHVNNEAIAALENLFHERRSFKWSRCKAMVIVSSMPWSLIKRRAAGPNFEGTWPISWMRKRQTKALLPKSGCSKQKICEGRKKNSGAEPPQSWHIR